MPLQASSESATGQTAQTGDYGSWLTAKAGPTGVTSCVNQREKMQVVPFSKRCFEVMANGIRIACHAGLGEPLRPGATVSNVASR